ncbi:MAG TPA: pyridoxal phosphate-dependent aminotransferase [Candidatus Limnocylindria bacterium]|nr:pyridoxal phosphate-dependent aminotransferase [Candidatus Limnocylindria bacterium]
MRVNIIHPGAGELRYEIRGIVKFAQKLARTGIDITWENIGDPVAKGEEVPQWVRDIVAEKVQQSSSYAYSPTKGLLDTRKFLADRRTQETGVKLSADNIIFFNGLGDAVTKLYTWLHPRARVLGPNPAYPTHSSIEGAHGRSPMLTYKLDPAKGWLPDVEDVRNMVKYNPSITALLIINPDNPTGMVYPREILEEFAALAREYDLFLIADEIYSGLAFPDSGFVSMAEVAGDLPTIVMRGLSKEIPWPGSRCGWLEFYNTEKDEAFARYAQSIEEAKMIEVCSTTLPQAVLPAIMGDERYPDHLAARQAHYAQRAQEAATILGSQPALDVVTPKGAFYLPVTFSEEFMQKPFVLPAASPEAQALLDAELANIPEDDPGSGSGTSFDKRFCYQLMAATGICTVPLSTGFNSYIPGFRMTLLEADDATFTRTLQTIVSVLG